MYGKYEKICGKFKEICRKYEGVCRNYGEVKGALFHTFFDNVTFRRISVGLGKIVSSPIILICALMTSFVRHKSWEEKGK